MITKKYIFISILLVCTVFTFSYPQTPMLINYQGKLNNSDGTPLEDGTYRIIFKIYYVPESGTKFWEETHDTVHVTNGVFNVFLGGLEAFHDSVFNTTNQRYLGIAVGNDQEFKPRYQLTSVPFAIHSIHADSSIKSQSSVYADSSLKAYQSVKADTAHWVLSTTGVLDGHSLDAADGDPSDAVFVDSSGNVGIGTTNPNAKVEIVGNAIINGQSIQARPVLYISFADKVDDLFSGPPTTTDFFSVDGSYEWINPREYGYTEGRLRGRLYIQGPTTITTVYLGIGGYPELDVSDSRSDTGDILLDSGWITLTSNSEVGVLKARCDQSVNWFGSREISVEFR